MTYETETELIPKITEIDAGFCTKVLLSFCINVVSKLSPFSF